MPLLSSTPPLLWSRDPRGLAIVFASTRDCERARSGRGPEEMQLAWLRMRLLLEQGDAVEGETMAAPSRGIFLDAEQAVRLDDDTRELFLRPPLASVGGALAVTWPGSFRVELRSGDTSPATK